MRKEVYQVLKSVCENSFQDYPTEDKNFPCLIWALDNTADYSLEKVAFYKQYLRVEIYASTSEERGKLEIDLIEKLFANGWINKSNRNLPSEDYYRQDLTFERKV